MAARGTRRVRLLGVLPRIVALEDVVGLLSHDWQLFGNLRGRGGEQ